jgi:hypothetical protein
VLYQAPADNSRLFVGERKLLDGWLERVPEILNELDPLRNSQPMDRLNVDPHHAEIWRQGGVRTTGAWVSRGLADILKAGSKKAGAGRAGGKKGAQLHLSVSAD